MLRKPGDLQRVVVTLPVSVAPNGAASVTINYVLPVEVNTGLVGYQSDLFAIPAAVVLVSDAKHLRSHFVVQTPRRLLLTGEPAECRFSRGVEKTAGSSVSFEQPLYGQPFFVQGDWEKVEGTGEGKGITAYVPKGASAEEKKRAEVCHRIHKRPLRAYFVSTL